MNMKKNMANGLGINRFCLPLCRKDNQAKSGFLLKSIELQLGALFFVMFFA